jgi:hypothetical protein
MSRETKSHGGWFMNELEREYVNQSVIKEEEKIQ